MRNTLTRGFSGVGLMLMVIIPITGAWRSFKVILTDVIFEANDKIVNVKTNLQNDSGNSKLTIDFVVYEDLEEVQLTVDVGLETDIGNYSNFINRSVNFCKLMKQRNSDSLMRAIYDDLLKHGNLFKECPIHKGSFSLTNYNVNEEILPGFLPESKFRFGLLISRPKNAMIFRGTIYGRIDKSKGFDNLKRFSLG
ncbi:hypothetical protein KR018_011595 [Drosophila ironensis]|nr:hypothetical protein KR018_011595 [Drosophila ironensis]